MAGELVLKLSIVVLKTYGILIEKDNGPNNCDTNYVRTITYQKREKENKSMLSHNAIQWQVLARVLITCNVAR